MFTLHPQLAADTTPITTLELCHVRLLKDANYPWLVLVPGRPDITGMHQLAAADGATLMAEIRHASDVLEKLYTPTRINVAALGNMVAQLHIHVIARFDTDAAWPGPVWGAVAAKVYDEESLQATVGSLKQALAR